MQGILDALKALDFKAVFDAIVAFVKELLYPTNPTE